MGKWRGLGGEVRKKGEGFKLTYLLRKKLSRIGTDQGAVKVVRADSLISIKEEKNSKGESVVSR